MNPRLEAAWEVHLFLRAQQLPYAIIGGLAVQRWGEPRFTRDIDLTVAAPLEQGAAALVDLITGHFASRTANPLDFALATRMLLVTASNGVEVDISLALPGYEDELFARAVDFEVAPGQAVRMCSPEDLIIHKAVAGRPQDLTDLQSVVWRQGARLDTAYIRRWVTAFAEALSEPDVLERFEVAWRAR